MLIFVAPLCQCAFDVGDYGLGYCANSLALGCDCLGSIYYFDAELVDSKGLFRSVARVLLSHPKSRCTHAPPCSFGGPGYPAPPPHPPRPTREGRVVQRSCT